MTTLSVCIPCHNRTYDLKKTLPINVKYAPFLTEFVILDYNSQDDLIDYIRSLMNSNSLTKVNLTYRKYKYADSYHMAHARNLSVLAAHGKYVIISSCDIIIKTGYYEQVMQYINLGYKFMEPSRYKGVITIEKTEFINAGGYDERFEYYGPEDKDLANRLVRRGLVPAVLDWRNIEVIPTPWTEKLKNYRAGITMNNAKEAMKRIYLDNEANQVLVANPGGWGSWEKERKNKMIR